MGYCSESKMPCNFKISFIMIIIIIIFLKDYCEFFCFLWIIFSLSPLGKKRRLTFIECNNDINSMIDVAKVVDLVSIHVKS